MCLRCTFPDCTKIARGKAGLCTKHGGGRRCMEPNCGKSARSSSDYCAAHGKEHRLDTPRAPVQFPEVSLSDVRMTPAAIEEAEELVPPEPPEPKVEQVL